MLLLMIYENGKHQALTNKATVPRVRHRAIKVSKYYLLQIQKQRSSLLSDKSNRCEVFGSPVAWSIVGCWVDPAVEFRFLHVVFNSIYPRVGDAFTLQVQEMLSQKVINLNIIGHFQKSTKRHFKSRTIT